MANSNPTRTITNGAIRSYKLPIRKGPKGPDGKPEVVGTQLRLRPGATLTVPAWYFAALLEERGWKRRMNAETGIVRGAGGGQAALFEAKIKAKREAIAKAETAERARLAEGQVSSLEKRLAALESQGERVSRSAAEMEARARQAEQANVDAQKRIDELERELAAARAAKDTAPPAPSTAKDTAPAKAAKDTEKTPAAKDTEKTPPKK